MLNARAVKQLFEHIFDELSNRKIYRTTFDELYSIAQEHTGNKVDFSVGFTALLFVIKDHNGKVILDQERNIDFPEWV